MHARRFLPLAALLVSTMAARGADWWKGNTHTHTYWSDGNALPEQVVDWYVTHGYDFLVLSDHNILQVDEKWVPVSETGRQPLRRVHVERVRERFGAGWNVERERGGQAEVRLKTLPELRARFEAGRDFLLIPGEEVTDQFEAHEVHVNAINIAGTIPPQGGTSVRDTIQRNVDAVLAHGRAHDRPVLAHINHPNYRWSLTAEDLAAIRGERFFEVYNGHRGVRNEGDDAHPSVEAIWDAVLLLRLTAGGDALYGVATDDAHDHHDADGTSVPGRGWVMVRAETLDEGAIIRAMRAGDFYASSGVVLTDVQHDAEMLTIHIAPDDAATYRTEFVGTRVTDGTPGPAGAVLAVTGDNPAVYRFRGDELYVRARVISSRLHPRPYQAGDQETAWVQPVVPGGE